MWLSLTQDVGEAKKKNINGFQRGLEKIKPDGPDAVSDVGNQYAADCRKLRGCRKGRIMHTPS